MRNGTVFCFFASMCLLAVASLHADENWRTEFENLCGKTEESMNIKIEELRELVVRCDKLNPVIEASMNPQKKVFLKRLEMCKKVFVFVIAATEKEK